MGTMDPTAAAKYNLAGDDRERVAGLRLRPPPASRPSWATTHRRRPGRRPTHQRCTHALVPGLRAAHALGKVADPYAGLAKVHDSFDSLRVWPIHDDHDFEILVRLTSALRTARSTSSGRFRVEITTLTLGLVSIWFPSDELYGA